MQGIHRATGSPLSYIAIHNASNGDFGRVGIAKIIFRGEHFVQTPAKLLSLKLEKNSEVIGFYQLVGVLTMY